MNVNLRSEEVSKRSIKTQIKPVVAEPQPELSIMQKQSQHQQVGFKKTTDHKFMGIKKLALVTFFVAISLASVAQNGTIQGLVTDQMSNESLVGATIMLEGTIVGTITDFDGNYILGKITPGTYNIRCSFISYEPITIENVEIQADQTLEFNFDLSESTLQIEDIQVVAKINHESESMLLLEQKDAAVSKETIGAQQLSIQGVSDAASAAIKITGITKQEGSNTLNIRGLGDRYNTTTLNGLPLPSNNAETKNIDLELFSTDIIEYIGVDKIFTSNLSGDFAGANINISSKKHQGDDFLTIGIKTGMNTANNNANPFYLQDGPRFLGFYNLSTPTSLNSYTNFTNSWNPQEKTIYPNLGLSISGGKTIDFSNSSLNVFFVGSFDNEFNYTDLIERKVNGSDYVRKDLEGEQFSYETQTTGMLNLNFEKNKSSYYFNSIFLNTSDQNLKNLRGFIFDLAEEGALLRRSEFERTTVLVNQLLGEHQLGRKTELKWGAAWNKVNNIMPDRRHNTLDGASTDQKMFGTNDQANNNRYFHDLIEDEYAGNFNLDHKFGKSLNDKDFRGKITLGYSGKYKTRNFSATQFNHKINENQLVSILDVDSFFNDENLQDGYFQVRTFSSNFIISSTYGGEQIINSSFANLEYDLTSKLLVSGGLRLEHVYQKIKFKTTLGEGTGDFTELNIFPSLSFKYAIKDKTNLRLSSGITHTLPQFKETAVFLFEGITDATVGNEYLYPSKNYNVDLKWEYYPEYGELLSAVIFGKYIANPINKFVMASASNDFTYANTGSWAKIYGIELEARKNLFRIETENKIQQLFLSTNLTLMHTNQELDNDKINQETNGSINANFKKTHEILQGAAPIIANASLSYTMKWNNSNNSITPTVVYGYTSDRLYLIGYASLGNQVDKAFQSLDFVVKSKLNKLGISLSAKNVLNPEFNRVQENETQDFLIRSYRKGIKVSFGLSYEF